MVDYEDRGIIKWQGMYLSDHTEKIACQAKEKRTINLAKVKMTNEEIARVLNKAIIKNKAVAIQKEEIDVEGHYSDELIGQIDGNDELGIYIHSNKVNYDEIRHVELYTPKKWSALD